MTDNIWKKACLELMTLGDYRRAYDIKCAYWDLYGDYPAIASALRQRDSKALKHAFDHSTDVLGFPVSDLPRANEVHSFMILEMGASRDGLIVDMDDCFTQAEKHYAQKGEI